MASQSNTKIVPFVPAASRPFLHLLRDVIDPVDLAELHVRRALPDLVNAVNAAQTPDAIVVLRDRIGEMVLRLTEVENAAMTRATLISARD